MKKISFYLVIVLISLAQYACKKEKLVNNPQPQNPATENPVNKPPIVNAGPDREITLPENSALLDGFAIDPDGFVASLRWSKISGSTANIQSPEEALTSVTDLVSGTYLFLLTATDNLGASSRDTVKVVVKLQPFYSQDTLYTNWFSIDTIHTDAPYSSYFWANQTINPPLIFQSTSHVVLNYVKKQTPQGIVYQRDILDLEIVDSSQTAIYSYIAYFAYYYNNNNSTGCFYMDGGATSNPEPPAAYNSLAVSTIQNYQYRVIVIPLSTYNTAGVNWDNYLSAVAALNITP